MENTKPGYHKIKREVNYAIKNAKLAVFLLERELADAEKEKNFHGLHAIWIAEGDLLDAVRDLRVILKGYESLHPAAKNTAA